MRALCARALVGRIEFARPGYSAVYLDMTLRMARFGFGSGNSLLALLWCSRGGAATDRLQDRCLTYESHADSSSNYPDALDRQRPRLGILRRLCPTASSSEKAANTTCAQGTLSSHSVTSHFLPSIGMSACYIYHPAVPAAPIPRQLSMRSLIRPRQVNLCVQWRTGDGCPSTGS